jgi:hypothetical protein
MSPQPSDKAEYPVQVSDPEADRPQTADVVGKIVE